MTAAGTTPRHLVALALLLGVLLAWAAALGLALTAAALPDDARGTVAVVFAPASGEGRRFATLIDAGGRLARFTRFDNVWVVYGEDSGFAGRLRAGGAWQVFEPALFEVIALPGCVPGLPVGGDA